jgi:hypothetical protein
MENFLAPKYFKKCIEANEDRILYELDYNKNAMEINQLIEEIKIRKKYADGSLLENTAWLVS